MDILESKLSRLINNEKTSNAFSSYSLENIAKLLDKLGNPHEKIKTVHIAGTNGKGSTAVFLYNVLVAAGYKTGLYTSPHLLKVNERIRVDDDISDFDFIRIVDKIENILLKNPDVCPTYFDVLTAACFIYFEEKKVDIAVVECGLGGRLDSTNVIQPLISIITEISFDHEHILGSTLKEISSEKAGIIKKDIPVVSMSGDMEAVRIIKERSMEMGSNYYEYNKDYFATIRQSTVSSNYFGFSFRGKEIDGIKLNLPQSFFVKNFSAAACAALLLTDVGFVIGTDHIKTAAERTRINGRLELLISDPFVYYDVGHNEQAIFSVLETVKKNHPDEKIVSIISLMLDKKPEKLISGIFRKQTQIVYYVNLDEERAYKSDGSDVDMLFSHDDPEVLVRHILPGAIYLFIGSFRLYGFAKKTVELKNKGKNGNGY